MDHLEAASLGATERYFLGMLDEEQREAFEAHFFDCLECAEDIRAAAAVLAGAGSLPEVRVDAPAQAVISLDSMRRRRLARGTRVIATFTSLAAALCLVVYQGLVVIPRLEEKVAAVDSLQAVPSYFLTQTRSEAPLIVVSPADRHVAITLSRSWDRPFPSYRCELRDASGRLLLAETLSARSALDELEVLLPVRGLQAGRYMLVVEGLEGSEPGSDGTPPRSSAPAARYAFDLERR